MMEIDMKPILKLIFTAWKIREESWAFNSEEVLGYNKSVDEAMLEACEGNEILARLLVLFSHWDNDLIDIAPHFGLQATFDRGSFTIVEDVPPAPSPSHYWENGRWTYESAELEDHAPES